MTVTTPGFPLPDDGARLEPFTPTGLTVPPTEPVRPRRRGLRIGILASLALATLALVVLAAGLALGNLQPASPEILVRYAGADTTAFVEVRLDLPGDQRQRLIEFLGHFPGLGDQAVLERRIADLFNQVAQNADEGATWEADVAPWFGGQLAAFATVPVDGDMDEVEAVIAASVRDRDAALEVLSGRAANHDLASEEYRGATIWSGDLRLRDAAIALTGDAILAARSVDDLRAALDVAAGEGAGLSGHQPFVEAVSKLHADRLATVYVDGAALAELYRDYVEAVSGGYPFTDAFGAFGTPGTVVAELRAEGNHLALTVRTRPGADGPPLPDNRSTQLAARMPADSVLFMEARDAGATVERTLAPILEQLEEADPEGVGAGQLETLLGTPPAKFLDFLEDVGVAVSATNGQFSGGVIATVTDEQVARQRMERLVGVLRTAAAFGEGLTITEEQYGDAMLTVIRVATPSFPAPEPGFGMPPDAGMAPMGPSIPSVSFTFDDGLLLLGVDDFVRHALDRGADAGLASTERYHSALQAGGAENVGVAYVDLAIARETFEGLFAPFSDGTYERDVKPYLDPFSRLMIVTVRDGDELVSRIFLYVE